MTKDEVLGRLADLAAQWESMSRMAGNRGRWTTWALTGESLFVRVFDSSDPLLVSFREAARGVTDGTKDWITSVHAVTGAFGACKAEIESAPPGEIESRLVALQRSTKPPAQPGGTGEPRIRLFISHSSTDARLTELVVKLLRSALGLSPDAMRATTVDGSRLPGGADTDEQIRREVLDAEAMIVIVSVASLESQCVAFEVGARWGAGLSLIPLMAPGVSPSTIKGPLGGKNALRADRDGELHQFVTDLATQLGITPNQPASYLSDLNAILSLANAPVAVDGKTTRPAAGAAGAPPAQIVGAGIAAVGGAGGGYGIHIEGGVRFENAPPVTESTATVSLLKEGHAAILCVKNEGALAQFYATLRVAGSVYGLNGSEFVRWTHTDAVKATIPRGVEFRAKLAELEWSSDSQFARWRIFGVTQGGVVDARAALSSCAISEPLVRAPDLVVSGQVIAEPDLRGGPKPYRVVLKAFGVEEDEG